MRLNRKKKNVSRKRKDSMATETDTVENLGEYWEFINIYIHMHATQTREMSSEYCSSIYLSLKLTATGGSGRSVYWVGVGALSTGWEWELCLLGGSGSSVHWVGVGALSTR